MWLSSLCLLLCVLCTFCHISCYSQHMLFVVRTHSLRIDKRQRRCQRVLKRATASEPRFKNPKWLPKSSGPRMEQLSRATLWCGNYRTWNIKEENQPATGGIWLSWWKGTCIGVLCVGSLLSKTCWQHGRVLWNGGWGMKGHGCLAPRACQYLARLGTTVPSECLSPLSVTVWTGSGPHCHLQCRQPCLSEWTRNRTEWTCRLKLYIDLFFDCSFLYRMLHL